MIFYDLRGEGEKIQVIASAKRYDNEADFFNETELIKRGDIVGIEGHPGKTKTGELSIVPKKLQLLSPCLRMLPNRFFGLKDKVHVDRTGCIPSGARVDRE